MTFPVITTAFTGGEIAPGLWGRIDYSKFAIGAATLRNFYVGFKGGAYSRAGTEFVGYSKQTTLNVATGSIHFPSNPTPGQKIFLNGLEFEFVASGAGNFQFNIQGNAGGTIALAVNELNTNPIYQTAALNGATYSDSGGGATDDLIITWKTSGASGNSYTLAADAPATVSGPTLSGGGATPPRLIPFQFNLNQGLVLEFGERYMRVISQGGFVLEPAGAISAITKANPATVTEAAHGYTTGDWIFIAGVGGMVEVNGNTYVITVTGVDTYTLADVFGTPIDSSAYTTYTGGGTGSRIFELVTPYAAADLPFLKYTQSADVMTLCLRNQQTGTEYPSFDLGRLADDNWVLTEFSTAAPISPPANPTGSATVTEMTDPTDYQYVITAVDRATQRESVASDIINIPDSVDISSVAGSEDLSWDPVSGALYYNIYKAPPAYKSTVPIGSLFGYAGQTFGTSFNDSNIVQDMLQVPPLHKNPFLPGQALDVTITSPGSSLGGPIGFTITTVAGSGAAGYGVLEGGEMLAWVFTDFGGGYLPGDTIQFFDASAVAATGNIDFTASGNPANGSTITLNGRVFTFVNDASGWPNDVTNYKINIAGSLFGTLAFLADPFAGALTTGATYLGDTALNVADYSITSTELDIVYKTPGVAGNSYTLAASAASPSAATLTGGTGGDPPTGDLIVGPTSGTYPSVPAYFQQRRVYANTANQPDTYWMSQPGDFKNFDSRIPVIDSDSITGTPWSVQVDGIQFMLPLLGGLIMLTGQAAYQVSGAGGSPTNPQPITPSSQQAVPQAYNGCHFFVPPVQIDYDVYYLQAKGSVIRNLSYNFWINVFTGVDITYLSSHLFNNFTLTAMSWAEEPYKILWVVRDDGVMLSLTNLKSQEVMAWARHDTQGRFVSCVTITEPPVDALYVATQRFFGTDQPFIIERMNDRLWRSVEDIWCVDSARALVQPQPNATLTISTAVGLGQPVSVTGLVGGINYSTGTVGTVVDLDKIGTGCTAALTITGGVITAATLTGGTGYKRPVIQFIDPNNSGSGASAFIVLNNAVTVTADLAIFVVQDVGKVVRAGGGVIEITAYAGGFSMTGQVVSPITEIVPNTVDTVPPFDPGEWTFTRPVTLLRGLTHLAGQTVVGIADGGYISPRTVSATGTITLGIPASSIVVGLAFQPQIQSLYVEGGSATAQGRRKNISAVSVLVEASGDFLAGTNQPDGSALSPQRVQTKWQGMAAASVSQPGLSQIPYVTAVIQGTNIKRPVPLYTGYVRVPVGGGFEKPGQVAVQQDLPYPIQVLDFVRETDLGDTYEDDRPQRQG